MFFGVGPGDSRPATRVLYVVAGHGFHPATRVAAIHSTHVVADITGDLAFAVTDNLAGDDRSGNVALGYESTMLTPERWSSAAVAAVSSHTTVEVW